MRLDYFSEMPHHGQRAPLDAVVLLETQESRMDHPTAMRSIELMGAKVIPALAST